MAETIVLAELQIGADGVITGVAAVDRSLERLEDRTRRTGQELRRGGDLLDAVGKRMFNLKAIATSLVGSFTVAGIVLKLVDLATSAIAASDAFQALRRSARDAWGTLVEGESTVEQTSRNMAELLTGTGVTSTLAPVTIIEKITKAIAEAEARLEGLPALGRFGATQEDVLLRHALLTDVDQLKRKLLEIQEASGLGASAFDMLFGTDTQNMVVKAKELVGGFVTEARAAVEVIAQAQRLTGPANWPLQHDTWFTPEPVIAQEPGFVSQAEELGRVLEGDIGPAAEDLRTTFEQIFDEDKFASVVAALTSIGVALSQILTRSASAREAFRGILEQMSILMFAKAAEYVAYAIAASTGIGSLTLQGTPAQFLKAALKFAAAGVATGLAARAIGSTDAGGGEAAAAAAGGSQRPAPSVTVIVEGNIVGNEAFTRQLTIDLKRALGDGSAGGSF